MWLRVFVSVFLTFAAGTASAQNLPVPDFSRKLSAFDSLHTALLGSVEADSIGNRSAYVESTFAPFSGIYESGFRLRAIGNASWYRYLLNYDPRIVGGGHYIEGGLLAGYGVWLPGFSLTGLIGPTFGEMVNEGLTSNKWGAKGVLEIQVRPNDWTFASSSASYSNATNNLQVQAKGGVKIAEGIYFGPETKFTWQNSLPWQAGFFSSTSISTIRFGAHHSAINISPVLIGVSGGWAYDPQLGSGYYGSTSLYLPF